MTLFEEHLSEVINEIVPSNLSIHLCFLRTFSMFSSFAIIIKSHSFRQNSAILKRH